MKLIGCLLMFFVAIVLVVLVAGFKIVRALFGIKGNPFIMFKTMKDVHQNVRNMQEEIKRQAQENAGNFANGESSRQSGEYYHNETSQQRTDTTSPGAQKIIPDDEGEYVSYEEIKEK